MHKPTPSFVSDRAHALGKLIASRKARIGIIGMGYVGQPLAIAANKAGFDVIGFDIDPEKVEKLNSGVSFLRTIPSSLIKSLRDGGRFRTTAKMEELAQMDVAIICVPTPLDHHREPDLYYVEETARTIGKYVRHKVRLVALESTTYPGTTRDVGQAAAAVASGLKVGSDFFLAFSPEREDPGNASFHTMCCNIPKVVGADDDDSRSSPGRRISIGALWRTSCSWRTPRPLSPSSCWKTYFGFGKYRPGQ